MTDKPTLLLVEDEEDSRETLRELLELRGYRVIAVPNGKEALAQLDQIGTRCIVLLDLIMPIMNGWQVVEQLRADGRLPRLPVLITTSAAHNAPPDLPVIAKPVELSKLIRMIEAHS